MFKIFKKNILSDRKHLLKQEKKGENITQEQEKVKNYLSKRS